MYIRFGEIPKDGCSKIHRGNIILGNEQGVSVWDCAEIRGQYCIVVPKPCNEDTIDDLIDYTIHSKWYLEKKCYLVNGDFVGYGTDNEPLIKNVKIIKELTGSEAVFGLCCETTEDTVVTVG